jgi:hypothetical protein
LTDVSEAVNAFETFNFFQITLCNIQKKFIFILAAAET